MPDLVRFESSREVLAVKNGGVVEIESGGMIRVNGVPFPIQLTAPLKDGDLMAWDKASGKFVNRPRLHYYGSNPSMALVVGTGNDAGGVPTWITDNAQGITLDANLSTLHFPTAGYYLFIVNEKLQWVTTPAVVWTEVDLICDGGGGDHPALVMQMPPTTMVPLQFYQSIILAQAAGSHRDFLIFNNDNTGNLVCQSAAIQVQYLGPL